MQCSRARLPICLAVAFIFVLVIPLGAVADEHVEFGMNRAPMSQPLAFTNDEPANGTVDELDPDISAIWLLGESGSGSYDATECSGALGGGGPGGEQSFQLAWASEPLFPPPSQLDAATDEHVVMPLDDMTVPLTIGATMGLPEPVATGDVTFTMGVGWIRPGTGALHGPHPGWTGESMVSPSAADLPLPGAPGTLPGNVSIPVTFSADNTHIEANAQLVYFLTVECAGDALFQLSFDDIGSLAWVWGDPAEDDLDGDGLPNSLDTHPDGTEWSREEQIQYETDPLDPSFHPGIASDCDDLTIAEAKDRDEDYEYGDPSTCPGAGGLNPLLLILALLLVVLLAGGAFGAVTTVNKKVRMTVSHDGFQDVKQGESAQYELLLTAKGKEDEEVPVELSLKGVPEDWSASVEPAHLTLVAGEEPEPVTANLTVTPPSEEEYEAEAVVTVTATPTDENGKTSPIKPGTSVKTKTIVNIDVEPPEGEKRKKVRKPKRSDEGEQEPGMAMDGEGDAGDDEGGGESKKGFSRMKGGLGLLKRKGRKEEEEEASDEPEGEQEGNPGSGEPLQAQDEPVGGAAGAGKPDLAVGKLAHDPADFSAGDEVTTTVPVKNKGSDAVEGLLLRLYVNDDRIAEEELDLDAGEASEVTFTWTAQPDENRVRVRGGLKED